MLQWSNILPSTSTPDGYYDLWRRRPGTGVYLVSLRSYTGSSGFTYVSVSGLPAHERRQHPSPDVTSLNGQWCRFTIAAATEEVAPDQSLTRMELLRGDDGR